MLFERVEPVFSMVRSLGCARSTGTERALRWADAVTSGSRGDLLYIDTMGHGSHALRRVLPVPLVDRALYMHISRADEVLAAARSLIATGAVSCVIIDDIVGVANAGGSDESSRVRESMRLLMVLASLCTARGAALGYVDRISEGRVCPAPLGFTDILGTERSAEMDRSLR